MTSIRVGTTQLLTSSTRAIVRAIPQKILQSPQKKSKIFLNRFIVHFLLERLIFSVAALEVVPQPVIVALSRTKDIITKGNFVALNRFIV